MRVFLSKHHRLAWANLVPGLVALLLMLSGVLPVAAPTIQAQYDENCGTRNWYVYHRCGGAGWWCRLWLTYSAPRHMEIYGDETVLGVYRTEKEARADICARTTPVTLISGGYLGDVDGDRYNMGDFLDYTGKCYPPAADTDDDGVRDQEYSEERDRCPNTPPGTPVDYSGCPCDAEPQPQDCTEFCVEFGPHAVGKMENGRCRCTCEEGYELGDLILSCVPTKETCDKYCREYHGSDMSHGLAAEGEVDGDRCNCHCKDGFEPDETLTCIMTCQAECEEKLGSHAEGTGTPPNCKCECKADYDISTATGKCVPDCTSECKQKLGSQAEGLGQPPNCKCDCQDGYEISSATNKCEVDCNAQCKKTYGNNATGTGDPLACDPCECAYPWVMNTVAGKCEKVERFIPTGSEDRLITYLRSLGYDESACPATGPAPPGSITFWRVPGGGIGHSSVTLSGDQQLGMGHKKVGENWDALYSKLQPTEDFQAELLPPGQVPLSTKVDPSHPGRNLPYDQGKRICPPPVPGPVFDWKCLEGLKSTKREYRDNNNKWNCHGFCAYAISQCVDTKTKIKPGTTFRWQGQKLVLDGGTVYSRLKLDVNIKQGRVRTYSEYTIEVQRDGTAAIRILEGHAEYRSGENAVTLSAGQMAVVDPAGMPSAPESFDTADIERWWVGSEEVEPLRGATGVWSGVIVALALGVVAIMLAALLFVVWRVARLRRLAPAGGSTLGVQPFPRKRGHAARQGAGSGIAWASLSVRQGRAPPRALDLDSPVMTIGRSSANDIVLQDGLVSRRHAQIRRQGGGAVLYDLTSSNGTLVNGQRVKSCTLRAGDVIRIGGTELVFGAGNSHRQPAKSRRRAAQDTGLPSRVSLVLHQPVFTIGRSSACDLVLVDGLVSRRHAQVRREHGMAVLYDLGSTNGTYLNGERITDARVIQPGDVIRLGRIELVLGGHG